MTAKPNRTLPNQCPSCGGDLAITALECADCATEVRGHFRPCPICRLRGDTRKLFDLFIASRGNLKAVQRALGVSYPTVRARVEEMFQILEAAPPPESGAMDVLARLRAGEIGVDEAETLLGRSP